MGVQFAVVFATALCVVGCIALHYEGLTHIARRLSKAHVSQTRRKVLYAVLAAVVLHVVEIWMFGLVFWLCLMLPGSGAIAGAYDGSLLDAVYLSAVTYTTVGFGDVAPVGAIRFIAGTEALVGFMMITWTASFTFLEMQRYWRGV